MKKNIKKQKKAFTLIEIIVVLVVIGMLAVITFGVMQSFRDQARDTEREVGVQQAYRVIQLNIFEDGVAIPKTKEEVKDMLIAKSYALPKSNTYRCYIYGYRGKDDFFIGVPKEAKSEGIYTASGATGITASDWIMQGSKEAVIAGRSITEWAVTTMEGRCTGLSSVNPNPLNAGDGDYAVFLLE